MVEFKEEGYEDVINEILPLLEGHWQEIALNQDTIKLNPDYEQYKVLFRVGAMRMVTAREEGKLVGYCICLIRPHIHYKDSLTATNDIFYIHPDYRKGMTGVKLFKAVETIMKSYGVQRIMMMTKKHKDVGPIFERLGYTEAERVFTKVI